MITASKLAIAIAVAGPLAAATVGESFATPLPSSAVAVKAAAPAAATDVQYRAYDYGPYAYRPGATYPMEATHTGTPPIRIGHTLGTITIIGNDLTFGRRCSAWSPPPILGR